MVIFATPDWAAGYVMQRLLIISAVVLAISAIGILLGVRLLSGKLSTGRKFAGGLLLLGGCLFPFICYFATTPAEVRLENGTHPLESYPSGKIQQGMSRDDVKAILGPPQQRDANHDRETWMYLIDPYGEHWFGVDFGPDGRVTHTYGN
jgi:outer membrane protein assembly factor BamE (lipoprotein component of BamABCDE complex)